MKRRSSGRFSIVLKVILLSMSMVTLCACSFETLIETIRPSELVVDKTDGDVDEIEYKENFTESESQEETEPKQVEPEKSEPEIIQEEEPKTVEILGTEYDLNVETLDLSSITTEDVANVADSISGLSELKIVNLMSEEGESLLPLPYVATLKQAAPEVHFVYEFDLYDNHISTSDTEVQYINTPIGNEGEEYIRQTLTILDECEYFLLDDCGIDDEIMAGIREDFPETKVVWRIHVGRKSALTDDPIIRMTHGIDDTMTGPLKYCNEVVYMDLGHDTGITDISFTAYMPLLECLILSDAQFKDLSPLTNCPNLTWLELIYCYHIEDLSVISGMESIKYLNISNTGTKDISGIMNMDLDRFCCIGNRVSEEDFEKFTELHPDCMSVSTGNPYGYAWRYDDYGYTFFSYYARMREVFRYTQSSPGGFKFPEDDNIETNNNM